MISNKRMSLIPKFIWIKKWRNRITKLFISVIIVYRYSIISVPLPNSLREPKMILETNIWLITSNYSIDQSCWAFTIVENREQWAKLIYHYDNMQLDSIPCFSEHSCVMSVFFIMFELKGTCHWNPKTNCWNSWAWLV